MFSYPRDESAHMDFVMFLYQQHNNQITIGDATFSGNSYELTELALWLRQKANSSRSYTNNFRVYYKISCYGEGEIDDFHENVSNLKEIGWYISSRIVCETKSDGCSFFITEVVLRAVDESLDVD